MDEVWQRHKSFILQVFVGGVLFLVAFLVMQSLYGGADSPDVLQKRNASAKRSRLEQLEGGKAPAISSIDEQKRIAASAVAQHRELSARVGSRAETELDYVKESIGALCKSLGIEAKAPEFIELYEKLPQVCLTRLRDTARVQLVGRAAQTGMEIDETLGLTRNFVEEEIPAALHGLAIVTEVIERCFPRTGEEHPNFERVAQVRIEPRSPLPEMLGVPVAAMAVRMEVTGDPTDVAELLRSFNSVTDPARRMIVLEKVPGIAPVSDEEDTVRAQIDIVGLRFRAEGK